VAPRPPIADSCGAAKFRLFDHLVGAAQQRDRECEAECLCGPEVDNEFNFSLLDRQISGLLTVENTAGVDADQAVRIGMDKSQGPRGVLPVQRVG
jgi:hypothetical protein